MKKQYLNYDAIERHCLSIGREIVLHSWHPDYIVGLTRGGLLPATLLSQYLHVPMHSLDVSLRDNRDGRGPESNLWMAEDAMQEKCILIVDDINDSGETLNWIIKDWKNNCMPQNPAWNSVIGHNVRIATIVNNEASDFQDVSYTGLEINKAEEDVWIVFPTEEWWTVKP